MTQLAAGERTPTEIIAEYTQKAPVDVYKIADSLGLRVETLELGNDISGKIERSWFGGGYIASLNTKHAATRRRFTLAHEIAHFVLHRDMIGDGIADDAMYRSARGSEIERQANAYAATILMPAPLVKLAFRSGTKSFSGMAHAFDVSPEVAQIRMRELRL